MPSIDQVDTFTLGDRPVKRLDYGSMRLAGPGVLGRQGLQRPHLPCSAKW